MFKFYLDLRKVFKNIFSNLYYIKIKLKKNHHIIVMRNLVGILPLEITILV